MDAELGQDLVDDRLGRRIERARVDDHVAGPDEGQQQVAIAVMPLEKVSAASASSQIFSRSSRISWLGPLKRE